MSGELLKLVADLPEVYQPIFGHPELSSGVSRGCQDRLDYIAPIHNALRAAFGRDLRVLDLGCAQGFFSLSLAGLGAHVHGVDLLDKNIAVCEHLAREQSGLALRFETARLETVVERLAPGQYDLVLGLSVFHHLIHEQGVAPVQAILSRLAECANALVVEFALRDEPLYWGPSQPRLPRELLCGSSFVHQLALCPTHLSEIQRPLFYASNRWLVFAETAYPFISCATDPHQLAHNTHEASRLYFVGDEFVAKQYLLDHPTRGWHNKNEAEREREFLASPLDGFAAPQLIGAAQSESEALVVMERLHGRLLLDLLMEGAVLNRMSILRQILEQLVVLERAGIYHNDIRTWNVLVDDHGSARLIDFGALCSAPVDCVWPRNVFLAFFIFVRELATGQVDNPDPLRTIAISPNSLPEPYRGWALRVWQDPPTKWSFFRMLTYLDASSDPLGDVTANDVWNSAMEAALQEQKRFAQALRDRLDAFQTTHVIESQKFNDELSEVGSNLKELDAVRRECADRADLLQQQAHQMALRAVEAETLAAARAREVDQSAAHMRELVEIAKYQAELFNQQFAVRFTQFESTLAARQADSLATHAHLEWAQARVTEVETQNQRLYEQALRRADEAHAALRAAEARAASEERRAMSFEAELLLARAEKLEAGSACERAEQRC
ncbi:methyltransferase domain-containing protein, partial [Niveibacterium sp. 24ML]|uniref:methyltransferase domain-containing protein n=1 Tax=Niveibacterium sp. 24ML TaxID=2985512 RepID=UPI002271A82B